MTSQDVAPPPSDDSRVLRYAAFTHARGGGNPAGVVLDATGYSSAAMLDVAQALGYSETVFLTPQSVPGCYAVRYFSPLAEVAFCGHATVAAAAALAERNGPSALTFFTDAGPVEVTTEHTGEGAAATVTSVPTHTHPTATEQLRTTLNAFGVTEDVLSADYPVHVAFGGNQHLILGIASRAELAGLAYDFSALREHMATEGWTTVHAFWPETSSRFHVRNFFPPGGVVEDPATGAAAAAFGGYLRALHRISSPSRLELLQGFDMGSPSRLLVDVTPADPRVKVTGVASVISG